MTREDLLALRIQQLERRLEDIEIAKTQLKEARLKSKKQFDKKASASTKESRGRGLGSCL